MNSSRAGLLACSTDDAFPPGGSGLMYHRLVIELTATGIAPDLHRCSLLIAPSSRANLKRGVKVEFAPYIKK